MSSLSSKTASEPTPPSTPIPILTSTRARVVIDEGIEKLGPLVTLQPYAIELELRRGSYDGALGRLDKISAQSPRKETWLVRRGEILAQAGRKDEARRALIAARAAIQSLPPYRRQTRAVIDLETHARAALAQ